MRESKSKLKLFYLSSLELFAHIFNRRFKHMLERSLKLLPRILKLWVAPSRAEVVFVSPKRLFLSNKKSNDRADGHCYGFAWI